MPLRYMIKELIERCSKLHIEEDEEDYLVDSHGIDGSGLNDTIS